MKRSSGEAFSVSRAWRLVADLATPRPGVYWTDFVLTTAVAFAAASLYFSPSAPVAARAMGFVVAGFALFRTGSFIHEIVHFRRGQMVPFTVVWNLVCGVLLLMPSYFYGNHADHHKHHRYGTRHDGEYLPLGAGPLQQVAWFYAQVLVLPLFVTVRFLILAPLSAFSPRLRTWVLERCSSFVINLRYRREVPPAVRRTEWAWLEAACCLRAWLMLLPVALAIFPWTRLVLLYGLAVFVLLLNYIRNLTAHRYRNTGAPMSYESQLDDSLTILGPTILTELFFPLGLRYHALHHLFPSLPYHNLGIAHRRLMEHLPADSAYARTVCHGYWQAVRELVMAARAASRGPLAAAALGAVTVDGASPALVREASGLDRRLCVARSKFGTRRANC